MSDAGAARALTTAEKREALRALFEDYPVAICGCLGPAACSNAEIDAAYLALATFPRRPRPVHDPSEATEAE